MFRGTIVAMTPFTHVSHQVIFGHCWKNNWMKLSQNQALWS